MKKFLAILLAMMLALVSVAALAEGGNTETTTGTETTTPTEGGENKVVSIDPAKAASAAANPTKEVTVTIPKVITSVVKEDVYDAADVHPEVTLNFDEITCTKVELSTITDPTKAPQVTINALTIKEGDGEGDLEINLPSYAVVGVYTYSITENATNIAGMTEAADLELKVTVIQNTKNGNLEIGGIAVRQEGDKVTEIENGYKSGRLKVTKLVDGNMGDRTKEFPITITLVAPEGKTVESTVTYQINGEGEATTVAFSGNKAEVKVNLAHEDYVEIANIPEGVTYYFVEDAAIKHLDVETAEPDNKEAYKVEGEIQEGDKETIAIAALTEKEIMNTKEVIPDTGITLESMPYVLMMALSLAGFVVLKLRKREEA